MLSVVLTMVTRTTETMRPSSEPESQATPLTSVNQSVAIVWLGPIKAAIVGAMACLLTKSSVQLTLLSRYCTTRRYTLPHHSALSVMDVFIRTEHTRHDAHAVLGL